MTTNHPLCFASSHGGNHGSDPENPLQSAPFSDGNIFIGYYDDPNTPYADNLSLNDLLKDLHGNSFDAYLTLRAAYAGAIAICCCKGCCQRRGDCEDLPILQKSVTVEIYGKPIVFSFMAYCFWIGERQMFSILRWHGEPVFLRNDGRFSKVYSPLRISCSETAGSNKPKSSGPARTASQTVQPGSLVHDQARLDSGTNTENSAHDETEHDTENSDHGGADASTVTDQANTQSLKRKAGQRGQRQSPRQKKIRSITAPSRGEENEEDDGELVPLTNTQRAPSSQHQTRSQILVTALKDMLNQAFEMWPWAPESLAVRDIIRQMTVAAKFDETGNMRDLRKFNCELWAQLAVEAAERRA